MKTNMHYGALPSIFIYARKLRINPTHAEVVLWEQLRKHLLGYKFRRQHPTWLYVVDFYCHELKFVIEIDGGCHEDNESKIKDRQREKDLASLGLMVIRFSNEDVCFDINTVISRIYSAINLAKTIRYQSKDHLLVCSTVPPIQGAGG